MDYKYIEQLLDRYWNCETSLEEEHILQAFFTQKDVPVRLLPYRELFIGQHLHAEEHLDADFDKRILALTEDKQEVRHENRVTAKRITRSYKLTPFFRAAACVAVVLCIGMAVQQASLHSEGSTEYIRSTPQQVAPTAIPETAYGLPDTHPIDSVLLKGNDNNL